MSSVGRRFAMAALLLSPVGGRPCRAEPVEPWREFLSVWAEPVGKATDVMTGFPKRIRRTKDGGEMLLIPAGTFQMGAVPGDDDAWRIEKPAHAVTLEAYYMDVHEVTVGQWRKYVAGGGGRLPGDLRTGATDAHPIHNVDWGEASAFAGWVGAGLPTEAQWERAAKGGHDDYVYPWGKGDDVGRRNGSGSRDGFPELAPVKSFAPNDFGLYDMSGNVREWCADWFDSRSYAPGPSRDPSGPTAGSSRVVRGAGWSLDKAFELRASMRSADDPSARFDSLGFRLARSLSGPEKAVEVRTGFLEGWAQPLGSETDAVTAYPKRIRRTKDGGEMVLIPAGTFQMGTAPGDDSTVDSVYAREKPRHAVTLAKAYYMDVHEVTVGQWKRYVAGGGGRLPGDLRQEATGAYPIHNVDWDEANAFARWVGAALPTEAQWERAAKGGHDDYVYPWGATDDPKRRNGRGEGDGFQGLAPVGSFAANDFGLYDMSGNVFEWCADRYDSDYYASSPPGDPPGPTFGLARVVRGGSWDFDIVKSLRASDRRSDVPTYRHVDLGFRLTRSP